MELVILATCDETRTFREGTLIRAVIEERYRRLSYNIDLSKRGWRNWKAQVPEDLRIGNLGRERIYEMIVDQALDRPLLSLMEDLASSDVHLPIHERDDGVLIRVLRGDSCHYEILIYEDDEGGLVVSCHNVIYDIVREGYPDIEELLDYEPSFEDLECDKS